MEPLLEKAAKISEKSNYKNISEIISQFEEQGFDFLTAWTMDEPRVPDRIVLPSREILDEHELYETKNTSEILLAKEFYRLVGCLNCDDRAYLFPDSFQNEEDIENCRTKYDPSKYKKTIFP